MTDFLRRLTQRRHSPVAVAAKLDRLRARKPDTLFLVVEALPDAIRYSDAARAAGAAEIKEILCEGKRGVLKLLKHVRDKYGYDKRILFFVDRDHDDFIVGNPNDPAVYVTDGYSFEADFVSPDSFRCVLTEIYKVDEEEAVIEEFTAAFASALDTFEKSLLPIMAWTIAVRRLGGDMNLNNAQLADLINIQDVESPSRKKGALRFFHAACARSLSLKTPYLIRSVLRELASVSPHNVIRGKYLMWFFLKYLTQMRDRFRAAKAHGERAHFIDLEVNASNVVQLLSSRLKMPGTLQDFLAGFV